MIGLNLIKVKREHAMVANTKRKIEVSLLGQRFTLRSDKSEEYVHAVAKYVTQQLEDIRKQTRAVSTHNLALLVALNLADELFQREEKIQRLEGEIRERARGALNEVQNALSLLPSHPHHELVEPTEGSFFSTLAIDSE